MVILLINVGLVVYYILIVASVMLGGSRPNLSRQGSTVMTRLRSMLSSITSPTTSVKDTATRSAQADAAEEGQDEDPKGV